MTASIASSELNVDDIEYGINKKFQSEQDFKVQQMVLTIQQSNWLKSNVQHHLPKSNYDENKNTLMNSLNITSSLLKQWKSNIKEQEEAITNKRRNALNPEQQNTLKSVIKETENSLSTTLTEVSNSYFCSPTEQPNSNSQNNEQHSSEELLRIIEQEFQLNQKQNYAFQIISNHFIKRFILKDCSEKPLRMLMTGPGGTGKTHVVKALQKVMKFYGCEHKIRFLAPTGSAASLIDGMTVHKGLGIKIIKADAKGKGNRIIGESQEDYTILVSIKNKTQLRDEWRNVDILLIDEASLLNAQLLNEIDHALRYAKERPDAWFGDVSMIFAGDFFQYPPVAGTALYTPISTYAGQTNDEIQRRLGRMAWKTVDTVIELSEQQRMKSDPEYASAVQRLRTRECHIEDVELFNSCLIKSSTNPEGIDMGDNENSSASIIVNTNLLRETLNMEKACALCSSSEKNDPELIICAAEDILPSGHIPLTQSEANQILHTNFSSSKNQGSLPGFVPLFIGMPVILRTRNLSTDLKITNGSQGYVRKIDVKISPQGLTHCSCVIVEFPDSPVKLKGLPKGHFPIVPSTWSFTTSFTQEVNKKQEKIKISRHQIPIQPAFAVTGHSAQGKTILKVLASLHEGGFGAYVAASRAKSRSGLYITHTVRLQDLNKPIPHDLLVEIRRLENLEHNTLVQHGFIKGSIIPIPEPESEHKEKKIKIKSEYLEPTSHKRKYIEENENNAHSNYDAHLQIPPSKKKSISVQNISQPISESAWLLSAGCRWDELNWSCAYDCVFMSLYTIFACANSPLRKKIKNASPLAKTLEHSFTNILNSRSATTTIFNNHRDKLRDNLSTHSPNQFHRYGHHGTSASAILDILFPANGRRLITTAYCSNDCDLSTQEINIHMPDTIIPSNIIDNGTSPILTNLDQYISNFLHESLPRENLMEMYCNICNSDSLTILPSFINPPPLLFFEIQRPNTSTSSHILPSWNLTIPQASQNITYQLSAIIYLGYFHFTSRLILKNGSVWKYNGNSNSGTPAFEFGAQKTYSELVQFLSLEDRMAHIYIYSRSEI